MFFCDKMAPVSSKHSQSEESDDEQKTVTRTFCLPSLNIDINAVIRNVGSMTKFGWYMTKTIVGAIITIIGCVKSGILSAAGFVGGTLHNATVNVLEAICAMLTSSAPSPFLPFIEAFQLHVVPLLANLSYYAGFLLVVAITAMVIYFTYEAMVDKFLENKLGFSTFEEELKKLNIEPILLKSIPAAKASLTSHIP